MESVYLKTLVEVVKTGSLSRAADTLCVTQPAVSRRIKFLEDQYGCALLDRSGPRLRPTEAGKLVYRKAEALLEIEADIIANLERLDGCTRIAFGGSAAFGAVHLPAVVREFMLTCGDRADLSFALQTPEQLLEGLEETRLDLAVIEMCDRFDLSAWRTFPLPDDEMVFVSAPALGLTSPETTVEPLFDVPLFTRREGCCSRTLLDANLESIGREIADFRQTIVFDDLHVIVEAALRGEGLSFLSRDIVAEHLAAGRLLSHRVPGFRHSRSRAIVLSRSTTPGEALKRFLASVFGRFSLPVPPEFGDDTPRGHGAEAASCSNGRAQETAPSGELAAAERPRP